MPSLPNNIQRQLQFQGRNLRHLIPLIGSAFRKVLQLKHVWPYYKLRFRPLFQNPLLNPSPNFGRVNSVFLINNSFANGLAALEHIELAGTGLEVTVLCSSRLNTSIGAGAQWIYCKVSLGWLQSENHLKIPFPLRKKTIWRCSTETGWKWHCRFSRCFSSPQRTVGILAKRPA